MPWRSARADRNERTSRVSRLFSAALRTTETSCSDEHGFSMKS